MSILNMDMLKADAAAAAEEPWRIHAQEWSVKRLLEPLDYAQSLLGKRFLERGGTLAVVAPSGVGKTVGSVQMAACWSIGREVFHIKPSAPLRVLVVQNEDTENDTKGPLQGVIWNCGFNIEDVKLMHANMKVVRLVSLRGLAAAVAIRALAIEWKADLVIVNPLMAFTPGKQGEETEVFVREHLQPIATELNCGVVAIHHTPKIGRMNGVGTGANEYERQYNAAGKADVVNAFRAILNIMPVGNGVFKFSADKRGRKIGWTWDGQPTIELYFKHASDPSDGDLVWWMDATFEEAEQASSAQAYQDILKVLPDHDAEPICRTRVRDEAKKKIGAGKDKADAWLKLALEDKLAEKVDALTSSGRKEALFKRAKNVVEVYK